MKDEIKYKLFQIKRIWDDFIWEYDFCKRDIKFNPEIKTNYCGDILGYFDDTLDIIFSKQNSKSHNERFSYQISLLQSIYVQQDLVEELLKIFKLKINKGDLKQNQNYSINRDIRNELIGHPIRRENGNGALISSCLFGYNGGDEKLSYLKYHRDNNFEFESKEYLISEIIQRHKQFLDEYFDKIIHKLKTILTKFIKAIENIERLIDKKSLNEILTISEVFFESIFESRYIYDKVSLLKVFGKREEHIRYQNLIDQFYKDLIKGLKDTKEYVTNIFEPFKAEKEKGEFEKPIIDFIFLDASEMNSKNSEQPVTYHYELGKLASKRNLRDFDFFSSCLRQKCVDNELVQNELNHMESNIDNEIEYYTAYKLICKELNEE